MLSLCVTLEISIGLLHPPPTQTREMAKGPIAWHHIVHSQAVVNVLISMDGDGTDM